MDRPVERVSYVRATLKGLALTLRHLVDPHKVTVQYPEERWDISPRWRGTHRMLTTEDGKAKCVACGLCPTVCPANCIKLVPGEDEHGEPLSARVRDRRVPLHLLRLSARRSARRRRFTWVATTRTPSTIRERFVYDLERLTAQTHPVSELWDPADPKGE